MKRFVTVASIVGSLLLASVAFGADGGKLGYIDMQKALNLSDSGKEAKEQLAAKVKKYQDEINAKQEELKKLKDDLEKQSVLLSEAARGTLRTPRTSFRPRTKSTLKRSSRKWSG